MKKLLNKIEKFKNKKKKLLKIKRLQKKVNNY